MKEKVWNYMLGTILILFGITFMIYAESAFGTIALIAGIVIITFSTLKLIISLKNTNVTSTLPMITSIIGIIFGIILVTNAKQAIETITSLIGIWFLIGGISKLLILTKTNAKSQELGKPIFKIIIGAIAFITPVIITQAAGYVVGIILILAGIATFMNSKDEEEIVYKVKVKK